MDIKRTGGLVIIIFCWLFFAMLILTVVMMIVDPSLPELNFADILGFAILFGLIFMLHRYGRKLYFNK